MSRVLLQLADLENTVNRCVQCPNDLAKLKEFLISDVISPQHVQSTAADPLDAAFEAQHVQTTEASNDTSRLVPVLGAVAAAAVGMFVQKFFFSK